MTDLDRHIGAYQTLHDGTLLDLDLSHDGILVLRAGTSLRPDERPEVLRLSFADFWDLVSHAVPLFLAHVDDGRRPLLGDDPEKA